MSRAVIIKALVAVLLITAALGVRVLVLERGHYMRAEAHLEAGETKLAIREYGSALGLYLPGSPYARRSAERLWQLGQEFEREGKPMWAQMSYSTLRSALYGARSFYTPGMGWIKKTDQRISALRAGMRAPAGTAEYTSALREETALLSTDRAPGPGWSALAVAAFIGFVASIVFIIVRGFGPRGELNRRPAGRGLLSAAVLFALWALALWMA